MAKGWIPGRRDPLAGTHLHRYLITVRKGVRMKICRLCGAQSREKVR